MSKRKSNNGKDSQSTKKSYGKYSISKPSVLKKIAGFFTLIAFIIHFIFDVIAKLIDEGITRLCTFSANKIKRCFLFCLGKLCSFFIDVYNVAADCVKGFISTCNSIHSTAFSAVVRYDMFKAIVGKAWHKKKSSAIPTAIKFTGKEIYNKRKAIASAFNIILPAAAITVFAITLNYWTTKEYGLVIAEEKAVDGSSVSITAVQNEKVLEKATALVAARLIHSSDANDETDFTPKYRITAMDSNLNFASIQNVSDLIIKKNSSNITEATGLYADGQLIGAMENRKELEKAVEDLQNEALSKFTSKKGYSNAKAKFAQEIEYIDGLYPLETIYDGETFFKIISKEQNINSYYTVEDGDDINAIERNTGLSLRTLTKLNPGLNFSDIMLINTKIITSSHTADLTVQITVDKTYTEEIPYKTITTYDDDEHVDYLVVTQEGKNGSQLCVDTLTYENGKLINTAKGERTVKKAAVPKKQVKGTIQYLYGHSYGNFIWPVPYTHNITSYFEMRWGRMHRGLDIAMNGCYGEDIIASDGGYIEYAGYTWDYGNHIIIYHGNGVRTLYAHCSALYVSEGESVYQGQTIAAIGETGEAYGAHLHFEIRVNYGDNRVDPLDYL